MSILSAFSKSFYCPWGQRLLRLRLSAINIFFYHYLQILPMIHKMSKYVFTLMICKLEINNKQYSFLWLWLIGQGHRMESGWTGNWEFVLCPLPAVCPGRYVNVSILTATYIHQDNIDQTAVLQIISASSILCALYTLNF